MPARLQIIAEAYNEAALTSERLNNYAVLRMEMKLECVKSEEGLEELRARILKLVDGVVMPVGGAGERPLAGRVCRVRFNGPTRFVEETAWLAGEPEMHRAKAIGSGLEVSTSQWIERVISHHADCVEFFQSVSTGMGLVHPFFLITGGGEGAKGFHGAVERVCARNPILAFSGRLFCLREHGGKECKVEAVRLAAGLEDGEVSPTCVFSTEDRDRLGALYADMAYQALWTMEGGVLAVIASGVHGDGRSAVTREWMAGVTRKMTRIAEEGQYWTPDAEGRNKLKRKAEEAVTRMGNLMRRGFSPVVREFASLSPPGVMKAIGKRASPRAEGEPKRAAKRQCMF